MAATDSIQVINFGIPADDWATAAEKALVAARAAHGYCWRVHVYANGNTYFFIDESCTAQSRVGWSISPGVVPIVKHNGVWLDQVIPMQYVGNN